jgi:hypothetical protein
MNKKRVFRPLSGTIVLDIKADLVTSTTRNTLRRNTAAVGLPIEAPNYAVLSAVVGPEGYSVSATENILMIDTPATIEAAIGGTRMTIDRQFINTGKFPEIVLFAQEPTRVNLVVC